MMMRALRTLALCGLVSTAACSASYQNHGYAPLESDLENLVVGVDTRATVDEVVGPPSISGLVGDGNYYYVRSRVRDFLMYRPEVVEREILAISFNEAGTIVNIERFGLQDGQVVPLARRVTDSSVLKSGFFQQLLRNIGAISPASAFGA